MYPLTFIDADYTRFDTFIVQHIVNPLEIKGSVPKSSVYLGG